MNDPTERRTPVTFHTSSRYRAAGLTRLERLLEQRQLKTSVSGWSLERIGLAALVVVVTVVIGDPGSIEAQAEGGRASATGTAAEHPYERELLVIIDGVTQAMRAEVGRVVDSLTFTLEKEHHDGSTTRREVTLDGRSLEVEGPILTLTYPRKGKEPVRSWLGYRYRALWSFRNGGSHDTGWVDSDDAVITLLLPYVYRTLELIGERAELEAEGVRSVLVAVSYPFFGAPRRHRRLVQLDAPISELGFELTTPRNRFFSGEFDYNYRITWHRSGGYDLSTAGTIDIPLIVIDEIPATAGEGT